MYSSLSSGKLPRRNICGVQSKSKSTPLSLAEGGGAVRGVEGVGREGVERERMGGEVGGSLHPTILYFISWFYNGERNSLVSA